MQVMMYKAKFLSHNVFGFCYLQTNMWGSKIYATSVLAFENYSNLGTIPTCLAIAVGPGEFRGLRGPRGPEKKSAKSEVRERI